MTRRRARHEVHAQQASDRSAVDRVSLHVFLPGPKATFALDIATQRKRAPLTAFAREHERNSLNLPSVSRPVVFPCMMKGQTECSM